MEMQSNSRSEKARQPVQFGLSKLIQFVTVAALWCSAGIVREHVTLGLPYTVVTAIVTWTVVGRWAVGLSPKWGRRVLAFTTSLLVAGGMGVTALVNDDAYLPVACLLTAMVVILPAELLRGLLGETLRVSSVVVSAALMFLIVYLVWVLIFRIWDHWSSRSTPHRLVWSFSVLLALLALPLVLSVLGGCYTFSGHSVTFHHEWLHCVLHAGMLVAAGVIVALLQHARQSAEPPPNSLKLLTLGYLCLYAVLLQVGLFPVDFRHIAAAFSTDACRPVMLPTRTNGHRERLPLPMSNRSDASRPRFAAYFSLTHPGPTVRYTSREITEAHFPNTADRLANV